MIPEQHLRVTKLLDFDNSAILRLINSQGWSGLTDSEKIGAAYDYVRNEIGFGYNADDAIPASTVLKDGHGQCNTKGTLLMALLRALGIACRLHGFHIHKQLQRGIVPEVIYSLAPQRIIHSWIEVWHNKKWLKLEGFILDDAYLSALQAAFPDRKALCAYGAGTDKLANPPLQWSGGDTFIQTTGIVEDLGVWDDPESFYKVHFQDFGFVRGLLYCHFVRHWMNRRVKAIRNGEIPPIPELRLPQNVTRVPTIISDRKKPNGP